MDGQVEFHTRSIEEYRQAQPLEYHFVILDYTCMLVFSILDGGKKKMKRRFSEGLKYPL
jgi:hypothetical protein